MNKTLDGKLPIFINFENVTAIDTIPGGNSEYPEFCHVKRWNDL